MCVYVCVVNGFGGVLELIGNDIWSSFYEYKVKVIVIICWDVFYFVDNIDWNGS